jgi:hypothetical protein
MMPSTGKNVEVLILTLALFTMRSHLYSYFMSK